jgi:hypothetical protein
MLLLEESVHPLAPIPVVKATAHRFYYTVFVLTLVMNFLFHQGTDPKND